MLNRKPKVQQGLVISALASCLFASAASAVQVPFEADSVASNFSGALAASLADINGDGNLDIVGIATGIGQIAWWENLDGAGAIWIERVIRDIPDVRAVTAADIDGDGDADVVAASWNLGVVAWLENDGTGLTWQASVIDNAFAGARSVHAADIDKDGDIDLVGAGQTADEIRWWENQAGDGSAWLMRSVIVGIDGVFDVETADVDDDGDADILSAAFDSDQVVWWENPLGDGMDWTPHVIASGFDGATGVSAADVDGDGDLDALGAAQEGDLVQWWENVNGDGLVWRDNPLITPLDGATAVRGIDLDRDGDTDILGAGAEAGAVVWWENINEIGTEWIERTVDTGIGGPTDIAIGDIDKDGDPDVAGPLFDTGEIVWWENETVHRMSVFAAKRVVDNDVPGASVVVAHDLDQDGDLDMIAAASTGQDIRWWENGDGGFTWTERIIDGGFNGALNVEVADVDGDGDPDVLGAAVTDDSLAWWENVLGDALTWVEHTITTTFNGAFDVEAADIDGDGDLDVFGAAEDGDEIAWFTNLSGDGLSWQRRMIDDNADGARSATAADFDGDGDLDILGGMEDANDITWWENFDGIGQDWITRTIEGGFSGADMVAAGDIDRDGDLDVVAAGIVADDVTWWENEDGAGTTWTERTIEGSFNGATSVVATDMDADGDIDILAAAAIDDDIRWWENLEGDGLSWREQITVSDFNGAEWAIFADVDDDGKPDVVGAAGGAGEIAWWGNRGGQVSIKNEESAPSAMADGAVEDLLTVVLIHEGRAGDEDVELASIRLLIEEIDDDPLDSVEANNLFEAILFYADDGDREFDPAADTLVREINTVTLEGGILDVVLPDDTIELQVPFGAPGAIFVAVELTADASLQEPSRFQFTHLTGESIAEDAGNDAPLEIQIPTELTSRRVNATGTPPELQVVGVCPGPVTIIVSNVTPGELVRIAEAEDVGDFTLQFGRCAGVDIGLDDPRVLLSLIGNIDGLTVGVELLNENQCGNFLQAQDGGRCLPSNVVQTPIPPPVTGSE